MVEEFGLNQVPSKGDLDDIETTLEKRRTKEQDEVVDGYTEPELLQYGVDKEKHSRKNIDYGDFDTGDRYLQLLLSIAGGTTAAFAGGDWNSVLTGGLLTAGLSEIAITKGNEYLDNPYDRDLEEAVNEYFEQQSNNS
jgi:hypothetical protein